MVNRFHQPPFRGNYEKSEQFRAVLLIDPHAMHEEEYKDGCIFLHKEIDAMETMLTKKKTKGYYLWVPSNDQTPQLIQLVYRITTWTRFEQAKQQLEVKLRAFYITEAERFHGH